ncbi:MAG: hypothetical protein Q8M31_18240 [Beijerinckiaceae bacterium]|nr:hypothetical protein [Beijerinckiaceae bacterium]
MNSIAFTRRLAGPLFAGCSILLAGGSVTPVRAQAPVAIIAPDPLREAFDALPDAERRALQDALVWTGDYKGSIDGVLGRGGVAALSAFAKRARTTPEALLADATRKQLVSQAQKLKTAARFAPIQDVRSGATIALPNAIFTRKSNTPNGARWTNAAGSASVETFRDADFELPALYERLRAPAPGRKVTYSILRPEFLVVTGEDQGGPFYIRAARGEADGKPLIRGYSLLYARTLQTSFDVFSIAISNGFQPFAAAAAPGTAILSAGAGAVAPGPRRVIEATAIALTPTRALTALARDCPDMRVANMPGKIIRRDEATGLTLIETQGLRAAFARPSARAPGEGDVFVLFSAQAGPRASVSLAPGRTMAPGAPNGVWRVSAAVQDGVGGAVVFDRSGSWMGLLAQPTQEPRRIAGVIPQAAWRMASAETALAFLAASGVMLEAGMITTVEKTAGEVAGANAGALVAVSCQR